jgi:hypothetical protein
MDNVVELKNLKVTFVVKAVFPERTADENAATGPCC